MGSVERSVRRDIRAIGDEQLRRSGLAATAITLARKLDEDAGMATAAVARELRAALAELRERDTTKAGDLVDELASRRNRPAEATGS